MRKLKLYLDTSVISHLEHHERQYEQQHTAQLWEAIKAGVYDVYLSDTVFEELKQCSEPKRTILFEKLTQIKYTKIADTDDIETLAEIILNRGVLPSKSQFDSLHIAAAVIARCDYIVSWNFKHMVNVRTNKGMRYIVIEQGYQEISLISPSMLLADNNGEREV